MVVSTLVSPPTLDDASLVEQALLDSPGAFSELVRRHQQVVRSCLVRWLGELHAADDVAQEVFLAAYRNLPQLQAPAEFLRWTLGIARRQAISHLRRRIKQRRLTGESIAEVIDSARLQQTEHDEDRADWLERLRICLDRLAPHSRQLIERHYFVGESTNALAAAMGKNGGAIRMTLLRIRQVLQRCLTGGRSEEN